MRLLIAAALVATSAPVIASVASDEETTTTQSQAQPKQDEERRICRRTTVQASQSRLGRGRVCLTAAQWRARSDMSADDAVSGLEPRLRTQGRPVIP